MVNTIQVLAATRTNQKATYRLQGKDTGLINCSLALKILPLFLLLVQKNVQQFPFLAAL
jgi:hypothetical protein